MKNSRIALLIFASIGVLFVTAASAAFYKYQDKNGKIHYVDDLSKIPPEYREDLKIYKDTRDHLSDEDKSDLENQERKQEEKRKQDLKDRLRKRKETERKRQENKERQKLLKSLVTNVAIKGNSVLVPVKVTYSSKEKTALLVLDTGAEIVVLHKDFADQLNIRPLKKSRATVASGRTIPVGIAKLSSVEVGPHKKTALAAAIINPVGTLHHNGLLGMNFLRDLEYRIDFDNRVIVWKP